MSIIISDLHAKTTEPYRTAVLTFLDWVYKEYPNEIIIQLGDIFDSSSTHHFLEDQIIKKLLRFKEVHLIGGNHTQSKKLGDALTPLSNYDNIHIYSEVTKVEIENKKCLILPFIYANMKEKYEQLEGEYDYIFTHFETSETAFGEGVDPTKLKGTFLLGHAHIQKDYFDKSGNQHHVLGVPTCTRHGEQNQVHRIAEIKDDKVSFIEVPQYFTFRDVEYGDMIEEEWMNDIINIKNAPSIHSVHEKYKGVHIRETGITLKEFEGDTDDEVFEFSEDALQNYFNEFKDETELSEEKYNKITKYF